MAIFTLMRQISHSIGSITRAKSPVYLHCLRQISYCEGHRNSELHSVDNDRVTGQVHIAEDYPAGGDIGVHGAGVGGKLYGWQTCRLFRRRSAFRITTSAAGDSFRTGIRLTEPAW